MIILTVLTCLGMGVGLGFWHALGVAVGSYTLGCIFSGLLQG